MMNEEAVREQKQIVDFSSLEGDGAFPCPKCGAMISPDDETEEVYEIVDTKVVDDELVELVICCTTCRTVIKLTGLEQVKA